MVFSEGRISKKHLRPVSGFFSTKSSSRSLFRKKYKKSFLCCNQVLLFMKKDKIIINLLRDGKGGCKSTADSLVCNEEAIGSTPIISTGTYTFRR